MTAIEKLRQKITEAQLESEMRLAPQGTTFAIGRPIRVISDGNLSYRREVDTVRWYGFKIHPNWQTTDPAGHLHTTDTYHRTTFQPMTTVWCEEHNDHEERDDGPRRCKLCEAEIKPKGRWGEHLDHFPRPIEWDVEYLGRNERRLYRNVPDALVERIIDSGAIHPHLNEFINQPDEWETTDVGT